MNAHSNASAKLTPPTVGHPLQRHRLFAELDSLLADGVGFINGPPGSGKTVLAATYLDSKPGIPFVWYRLDAADGDLAVFFAHFEAATRRAAPRRRTRLPAYTPGHAMTRLALAAFSRQFFRSAREILGAFAVIVFDDLQELPVDSALVDVVLREACSEMVDGPHVILVGNDRLPPGLRRQQANGELGVLGWSSLKLTIEEATALASIRTVDNRQRILRTINRFDGWAAGIMLALNGAAENPPIGSDLASHDAAVFDYLATELFGKLDAGSQQQLLELWAAPELDETMARALTTDARGAVAMLEELARRNFMTQRISADAPTFKLHALFREFLRERARAVHPQARFVELQGLTAEILSANGRIEEAVSLWAGIHAWDAMAEALCRHAPQLLAQGRLTTLERGLRALPGAMVRDSAWLSLWLGSSSILFDPRAARLHFGRAYELFGSHDELGRLLAWCGVVDSAFYAYEDLMQLDPWIDEFDRDLFPVYAAAPPDVQPRVAFSVLTVLSFRRMGHPRTSTLLCARIWRPITTGAASLPQRATSSPS